MRIKWHPRKHCLYIDQNKELEAIRKGKRKIFTVNFLTLYNYGNEIGKKNNLAIDLAQITH
ncbi:hypothetical protein GCM10007383_35440 [Arenibacter certesii]|uniref:Uncharacterized protein n=1 Tax=Arenibacter certesii TaxID=228955 RepID=A0A918J6H7_9FLAO|nr:hypothetical protein GCM10007383_35440 [Arenibacter certesii]